MSDKWWESPNKSFEGRTPAGMWIEDYETVYAYLLSQLDGGYW